MPKPDDDYIILFSDADSKWIEELDPPCMDAFRYLRKHRTLQKTMRADIRAAAVRVVRRLLKQNGHPLSAPEGAMMLNALVQSRWVLDRWQPEGSRKSRSTKKAPRK